LIAEDQGIFGIVLSPAHHFHIAFPTGESQNNLIIERWKTVESIIFFTLT